MTTETQASSGAVPDSAPETQAPMSKQEAGRRGGRAQSEKKGAAARANGKLGGRGRKKPKQEPKQPKKRVRIEDLGIPGLRYASELDALSAEDLEATRRELGLD